MAVLEALRDKIENASISAFGQNKRAVLFGTTDCSEAAGLIGQFIEQKLSTRIGEVLFVGMSTAAAVGLALTDGRKVFLKVHAGELDLDSLDAVHRAQEHLRQNGVPAARLILPATEFANRHYASVHAFRDRGDNLRAFHKGTVEAAASGFASLSAAGAKFPDMAAIPDLFAQRRSPLTKRAPGIGEQPPIPEAPLATALRVKITEDVLAVARKDVLGHGDWASRNLRFEKGAVSSVFDFESLRYGPETILVGQAAVQYINEKSGVRDPAAGAAQFVKAYERATRRTFEGDDAVALDAGIALTVASFVRSVVRSDGMRDEDAPRIFQNFMERFRDVYGREYPKKAWI